MSDRLGIPENEKCLICNVPATEYCSFCMDEYDTYPRIVPSCYYCDKHYESIVETGNCCYGSEKVFGAFNV